MSLLKEQNQEMKTLLDANKIEFNSTKDQESYEPESTFITGGCENPYVTCENW